MSLIPQGGRTRHWRSLYHHFPRNNCPINRFRILHPLRYGRASFHSARQCQLIDTSITVAHEFLQGFHSITHVPWVYSIPLTAIAVRLTVALPLQIWSLREARKIQRVAPVIMTWARTYQKQVMDNAVMQGVSLAPKAAERASQRLLRTKRQEIYKRWNARPWATYVNFLQLPIWLSMMESLRRMVGMSGGLLSIIQGWIEGPRNTDDPLVPIEPSMASEGALWFQDLLVADPTNALPIILAATMFTNVTWGWKVKSAEDIAKLRTREAVRERAFKVLKRLLQGMSLWLAPVMIYSGAPAGLLIYWISSSTFATIQTQIVRKVMHVKGAPLPLREKGVQKKKNLKT
ncbi:hypothetical protein FQN57_005880 [Myotisia sp. PD_48]|nr:hypothetical protein FQN57_005880 [Myotisia sp. PD_48]